MYKPEPVLENESIDILIQKVYQIPAWKPDLVLNNKKNITQGKFDKRENINIFLLLMRKLLMLWNMKLTEIPSVDGILEWSYKAKKTVWETGNNNKNWRQWDPNSGKNR